MEELLSNMQNIATQQAHIEDTLKRFKEVITKDYVQLDGALNELGKQRKEVHRLEKGLEKLQVEGKIKEAEVEEVKKQLMPVQESINKLHAAYAPETGSLFVRLFLGQVNVKAYRDGERFRLKQEYEKFKRKTNPQFMLFVVLLIIFPYNAMLVTMWEMWMLYYYVTLALRENILKVNGSTIKTWWILHHYLSIAAALTMVLWPMGDTFFSVLHLFIYFSGAQGLVQILINRYQQGQLYKLVAMGKANIMDVPGEAEGWINDPGWTPSAMFLLPFLLFVQGFQLYLAYRFFDLTQRGMTEWQVPVIGTVFFTLGTGNLVTTITTYLQKLKGRSKHHKKK